MCSGSRALEADHLDQPTTNGNLEEPADGQPSAGQKRKRDPDVAAKGNLKDRTDLSFRQRARMADLSLLLDVILKTTGSR